MHLTRNIKAYYKCDTYVIGTKRKKITTALDPPYMANAETTCRSVSVVLKHVSFHIQEAAVGWTSVIHIATVNNPTNLVPASLTLDCYAAFAYAPRMKPHRKPPFFGGLRVTIVTWVVLLFWVKVVPVNSVFAVSVSFTNKVLSAWCGSSEAIISGLTGWLCGTCHTRPPTPIEKPINQCCNDFGPKCFRLYPQTLNNKT